MLGCPRRRLATDYHARANVDVRTFPNAARPGVGLPPKRESQRPLLPQHARHCPVLEAGSTLGFLVYPPLEPFESFYVGYYGEGRYQFVYYFQTEAGQWSPIFVVRLALPVGGIGQAMQDVDFKVKDVRMSREDALLLMRKFVVPEDLGTPPGAVTLRGATNFRTPEGWDTVYTPVFNSIERPAPPMLVVRVETDWYMHETEFRYVLQAGEGISCSRTMPIGQVFFVPREEITLSECSSEELDAMRRADDEFSKGKAAAQITTPYGLPYSPHYLKESRARQKEQKG
jgi:hypothetical protein